MIKKNLKLKAFTLTELLVVLGIVGILTLLALPMFDNLGAKAYEAEAETNLKHIKNLQEAAKVRKFEYSSELRDISFQSPITRANGGTAVFEYEIMEASKTSFIAKAKAIEDFDGDGQLMEITINELGNIETKIED
ncbi:MAG: prepilin-type N-terminal cleavage/methylation domain-containing protein [Bacteroidetes bacterium]|nr:prepilin-type N-terminal cleavage/methylation domain-containing protein [Bacteroidota bacterium]